MKYNVYLFWFVLVSSSYKYLVLRILSLQNYCQRYNIFCHYISILVIFLFSSGVQFNESSRCLTEAVKIWAECWLNPTLWTIWNWRQFHWKLWIQYHCYRDFSYVIACEDIPPINTSVVINATTPPCPTETTTLKPTVISTSEVTTQTSTSFLLERFSSI